MPPQKTFRDIYNYIQIFRRDAPTDTMLGGRGPRNTQSATLRGAVGGEQAPPQETAAVAAASG